MRECQGQSVHSHSLHPLCFPELETQVLGDEVNLALKRVKFSRGNSIYTTVECPRCSREADNVTVTEKKVMRDAHLCSAIELVCRG